MLACTAVVLVALFLTGAFSRGKPSTPARSVQGYLDAVADGDGERACGYLTGMMLVRQGGARCADRLGGADAPLRSTIRDSPFKVVSVHDGLAVVRVTFPPLCPGKPARRERLVLLDIHGTWKLSGAPPTGGCIIR